MGLEGSQARDANHKHHVSNVLIRFLQNTHVDQDTNNMFGGDHNSVIRKGIANGKGAAIGQLKGTFNSMMSCVSQIITSFFGNR